MFKVNALECRNYELNHSVQQAINVVYQQMRDGSIRRLVKPGLKHNFAVTLTLLLREDADALVTLLNSAPNDMIVTLPNGDEYTCNYTGDQVSIPDSTKAWTFDITFEGVKNE
jgi:hypothetical protein